MSSFEMAAAWFATGAVCGAAAVAGAAMLWRRRLGRFLSFAAHEINTPLTAVNMTVLNFISGALGPVEKTQEPWFKMLREQAERLAGIMGDLRDFIHLKLRDGISLQLEDVEPAPILTAAVESISWGFSQAGVAVRTEADADLPKVRADAERLQRVITAVLYHCRKFRASGSIEASVKAAPPGRVRIDFVYAGAKTSAEESGRSLALYYPARVRKDHILTATGLGLGVLRLFLQGQGGDLFVSVLPDGRSAIGIELAVADGRP
ncbi:MAG TPA: HAMP domain-containing sensor histidine kinase [Elusimicrobiota bacterium]|nr:HAMP domain-containing sensor histidine kinase [Elusimicrobiota bacterium]